MKNNRIIKSKDMATTTDDLRALSASDLFALIRELRADYGRLRLMDAALSLCGGREGATHSALREKVLLSQKQIGLPNWRYLELCPKCKGCGQVYAAYSLDSSRCDCHDGYVLEANAASETREEKTL